VDDVTALYRHFNSDGTLLYVGISIHPTYRTYEHSKQSPWFNDISFITIERFETRLLALKAETVAIKEEKPLHNVIYSYNPDKPHKTYQSIDFNSTIIDNSEFLQIIARQAISKASTL
jgi:hypothetical protein